MERVASFVFMVVAICSRKAFYIIAGMHKVLGLLATLTYVVHRIQQACPERLLGSCAHTPFMNLGLPNPSFWLVAVYYNIPTWFEVGTIAVVDVHTRHGWIALRSHRIQQAAKLVKELNLDTLRVKVRRYLCNMMFGSPECQLA